jgi:hypothetical protein
MVQLIGYSQVQSPAEQPAVAESTQKLIYRGMTYDVPQCAVPAYTPQEKLRLIGKRLSYRGATYEIKPALMTATSAPKVSQKLCYRGVTFWSSTQSTPSTVEYSVV